MTNLYQASVPIAIHKLGNLKHICQVGAKHVQENELEESALTSFRLYPDMLPFSSQIKIPTDILCGMTARLTGNDRFGLNDDAASFDDLIARIDATVAHLNEQNPDDYEGTESKTVTMQTPFGELTFTGTEYVTNFVFPNLYFHITTAYNILRHNGVKLSKLDYIWGG